MNFHFVDLTLTSVFYFFICQLIILFNVLSFIRHIQAPMTCFLCLLSSTTHHDLVQRFDHLGSNKHSSNSLFINCLFVHNLIYECSIWFYRLLLVNTLWKVMLQTEISWLLWLKDNISCRVIFFCDRLLQLVQTVMLWL